MESKIKTETPLQSLLFRREFIDGLPVGMLLIDNQRTIIDYNSVGATMVDLEVNQALDITAHNSQWRAVREDGTTYPDDELPTTITLRTGKPCVDVIVGFDYQGRARRWLSFNTTSVTTDGQVTGVLTMAVDVTERLQQELALKLLTEVNRYVMFATDDADPLQHLCEALVKDGHYALAWIGVSSHQGDGGIDNSFSAGLTDYLFEGITSWSGARRNGLGPVGTALRTGTTQVVNNCGASAQMEPWRERLTQFGLNSLLAIPFTPDGQRAVLAVYCRRSLGFDEATVQRLETITKEAEFGVSHARVVRRLETTLDETIAALGQMTEASDSYFTGHQIRVGSLSSRLAAMIALQYGLDDKMVKLIRQSGEVHDIGRIAIPSAILTKVEKLSALELDIVKRHTVVGHQILSKTGLPWPVAQVALEHHERMDGSGYPQGMIAGEICLAARIVAVADMIESVTNDRPYRPGITIEKALEQITRDAVTLYDADVVKACVSVFESGFVFQSISPLDFTPVG